MRRATKALRALLFDLFSQGHGFGKCVMRIHSLDGYRQHICKSACNHHDFHKQSAQHRAPGTCRKVAWGVNNWSRVKGYTTMRTLRNSIGIYSDLYSNYRNTETNNMQTRPIPKTLTEGP